MFPPVDTKNAPAVATAVASAFETMFPRAKCLWLNRLFEDVERLFAGRHPDYCAIDLRYHDLEHTLQATLCLARILEGRAIAGSEPRLTPRQFELAICGALLHDAGYLKLRSDTTGTGAKYTYCHVLRSCAFAASYLPTTGGTEQEIEAVLGAISCTGPSKQISRLRFREPIDRIIGCALATGDYLAQMGAPDYPDELEMLYDEFKESDDYLRLPAGQRAFQSALDLMERTPAFWSDVVRPKLQDDFQGVFRYLARPYPDGPNPYIDAVEANMARIRARCPLLKPAVTE